MDVERVERKFGTHIEVAFLATPLDTFVKSKVIEPERDDFFCLFFVFNQCSLKQNHSLFQRD